MVILNKSQAETFLQFLNGDRLWSWPNGQIQLGQSSPDLATINHLVREGFLDQNYEPTDSGRAALESWLQAKSLLSSSVLSSSDKNIRQNQPSR